MTSPCQSSKFFSAPTPRRTLISLTPLIDVVFILLVFFMLASSFLDWRSIELNTAQKTTAGFIEEQPALLVDVGVNTVQLADRLMLESVLVDEIRMAQESAPQRKVAIRPADGVKVQRVVTLLDKLNQAGIQNMTLVNIPAVVTKANEK